eukprot:13589004-Alexandrium_andersonii.AAC.1
MGASAAMKRARAGRRRGLRSNGAVERRRAGRSERRNLARQRTGRGRGWDPGLRLRNLGGEPCGLR